MAVGNITHPELITLASKCIILAEFISLTRLVHEKTSKRPIISQIIYSQLEKNPSTYKKV